MEMQPPWERLGGAPPQQPAQQPQMQVITPPRAAPPARPEDIENVNLRNRQLRNEVSEGGLSPGYRRRADGTQEFIPGGPADPSIRANRIRPLPESAYGRLSDGVSAVNSLDRALNSFDDNYAGNLLGNIENALQGVAGDNVGTPGQSQWWADIAATDNIARNALFGASLTAGEAAAWAATTVNPRMDPALVRENLNRRLEIARGALRRSARSYRANNYNPEAIEEALGEMRDVLEDRPATDNSWSGVARNVIDRMAPGPPPTTGSGVAAQGPTDGPDPASLISDGGRNVVSSEGGTTLTGDDRARAVDYARQMTARIRRGDSISELDAFARGAGMPPIDPRYQSTIARYRARGRGRELTFVMDPEPSGRSEPTPVSGVANSGPGAFISGVGDTVTLGALDEIGGVVSGAGSLLSGGSFSEGYDSSVDNFRANRDALRENNPLPYGAGQIAGGFLLPGFGASGAVGLARLGAGYGGTYGFNSADSENVLDRLQGAGVGAGIGAATGGAFGFGADRLAARGAGGAAAGRVDPRELMDAATRQGINEGSGRGGWRNLLPWPGAAGRSVLPADVGGPTTGIATSGVRQLPFGGRPIVAAAERVQNGESRLIGPPTPGVGTRVREIANSQGAPLRQEEFGDYARGALERFNTESGDYSRGVYGAARAEVGNQRFTTPNATQRIDQHLDELAETGSTDAPLIAGLERLKADVVRDGGLSVDGIRRLRTTTRAEAQTDGLRGTDYQRRSKEILDALSEDLATQLPASARAAFREGDRAWAERLDFIDDVETGILGARDQRSAEGIVTRLTQMSRGDSARTARLLNTLNDEEAGVFRASLINDLGNTPDGFSLGTFLTNYDKLNPRGRATLFGRNESAMNDLATIARGSRRARAYTNTSNTAGAGNVIGAVSGATVSTGSAIASFGKSIPIELITGRLLSSARFARLLSRLPSGPQRISRALSRIAAREPGIAADILPIQRALEGGARSAAAEDTNDPGRVPVE